MDVLLCKVLLDSKGGLLLKQRKGREEQDRRKIEDI